MKKILKVRFDFFLITFLFLLFFSLYSSLSVVRHNHFQSQGNDFSIYDQALWLYSKFDQPYSTITFEHDLANRFRPIMLPISSVFWFTGNERVILILQSLVLCAAVFPIWLLARRYLPWFLSLAVGFIYLDYAGIASAVVYDFHEMAFLPFFLAWLFYFLEKRAWKSYFAALILSLSVREHVGFLLSAIGFYVFFSTRNLGAAILTSVISILWSILAIFYIMPSFGQTSYASFVEKDDSLLAAGFKYFSNPLLAIKNFFAPFSKIHTLFFSFFSFGFLPILGFALMPAILLQFASRFLDLQHPIRHTLYFHYSVELAVFLAIATILGAKMVLVRWRQAAVALTIFLVGAHFFVNIVLPSPLSNLFNPQFWQRQPWMQDTALILSMVPQNASVETQNNLMPHLSHRREVYILPIIRGADYIVLDLRPGQDNWNFYTDNLEIAKKQFKDLVAGGEYRVKFSAGDAYLLGKK